MVEWLSCCGTESLLPLLQWNHSVSRYKISAWKPWRLLWSSNLRESQKAVRSAIYLLQRRWVGWSCCGVGRCRCCYCGRSRGWPMLAVVVGCEAAAAGKVVAVAAAMKSFSE